MRGNSKKKILITFLFVFMLLFQLSFITPSQVSAATYTNNTLTLAYRELRMKVIFNAWNDTSWNLGSTETTFLQDYTSTNFKIGKIIIFNDSNDNGFFDTFEDNVTISDQLNYSNFSPYPNSQSITGQGSVPGVLINCSAMNSTINPNVTFAMHTLGFQNPTSYQGVTYRFSSDVQFKFNLNISNWPNWGNDKLILILNISSSLQFTKDGNSLETGGFEENPGPDADDDELMIIASWSFFQNATLNSSLYVPSNESISGSGGDWVVNFTFNKFDNLSFNGSQISFDTPIVRNNLLSFILFAVMLCAIIATTVIIYYTREKRNKFLDDIE